MSEHTIELTKLANQRTNPDILHSQVDKIIERVHGGNRRSRGWSARRGSVFTDTLNGQIINKIKLILTCTKPQNETDLEKILPIIQAAGNGSKWQISSVNGQKQILKETRLDYFELTIPDNWFEAFSHLYGLDNQIKIAMSSVQAAIDSDWRNRFHCAFVGAPASGKSDTARTFKSLFGEEAVLEYDATSTTMAGAIKDLDSREVLPRLLIVEEIEKADEQAFRWLLAVMDYRAEIRKVNYRQTIQKETKLLAIVTINDYDHFKTLMSGALASRCGNPIFFPTPSRDVLKRILQREVLKVNGNTAWIEPTLDFAKSTNMSDPRHVTAVCLRGKDLLLTGEYQAQLLAVQPKAEISLDNRLAKG